MTIREPFGSCATLDSWKPFCRLASPYAHLVLMQFLIFMPVRTPIWIQPTVEGWTLKNLRPKREDTVGPLGGPFVSRLIKVWSGIWQNCKQTKSGSATRYWLVVEYRYQSRGPYLFMVHFSVGTDTLHHLLFLAALFRRLVVHLANLPILLFCRVRHPVISHAPVHPYLCLCWSNRP